MKKLFKIQLIKLLSRIILGNLLFINFSSICVAHRLITIKNSDCIYVVNSGKIIESGKFNELIE